MTAVRLLAFLSVFILAACGFQPLYGDRSAVNAPGVRESLNGIYISAIPDQPGQYLRNALIDRFYSSGRPGADARYNLTLSPIFIFLSSLM